MKGLIKKYRHELMMLAVLVIYCTAGNIENLF